MSKVISIVSGKGGTGKSLFAANMGALLAMGGSSVVLIDMDMGLRNLDIYLGLENRVVYNVMDVLSGLCRIKQALVKDKRFKALYLMSAAPPKDERDITPLHMKVLCERLKEQFDYIIIDGSAGIGDGLDLAVAPADTVLVITEAEAASIRDADVVDRELTKQGIENKFAIINKVDPELMALGAVPTLADISKGLRIKIAGIIQYDRNIFIATNKGMPIVMKLGTYIERNFSKIVKRITEGE
ncbi:MAG: septum site-determining protein MinD [Anaerovoracaceae bacterium]|jgi:septum site-determining protein MinD|nr:septum site-determining protein MinD [Anaerovoracaceae bacterium]